MRPERFLFFTILALIVSASSVSSSMLTVTMSGGGCGSTYRKGEMVTMTVHVSESSWVTVKETTSQGTTTIKKEVYLQALTSFTQFVIIKDPEGTHTITVEARSISGATETATCAYTVAGSGAAPTVAPTQAPPPQQSATIMAFVRDQEGKPLAGATITVDGARKGTTDASGSLSFKTTPGTHMVAASLAEATQMKSVTVSGTASVEFTLDVKKSGIIAASIRDQDGLPVDGAEIFLDGSLILSGVQGSCEIPGVAVGPHAVKAQKGSSADIRDVVVESGKTASVTLTLNLPKVGTISLSVIDSSGTPVPGAMVFINDEGAGTTDQAGAFRKEGIPAGRATILVSKEGHTAKTASAEISPGAEATLTVLLPNETNYLLYGGIGIGALLLVTLLIVALRRKPAPAQTHYPPPQYPPQEGVHGGKVPQKEKVKEEPSVSVPTTGRILYCKLCHGALDKELNPFVCECGQPYHEECARRHNNCPACGRVLGGPT